MPNLTQLHLQSFGRCVRKIAGEKVREKVMEGSDRVAKSTDKEKLALWMKEAVDRLDACATKKQCSQIMEACGRACYTAHANMMKAYRTRRMKYKTEAEFLQAEVKRSVNNSRFELRGNTLVQYYTPKRMKSNERCFCSLIKHLPEAVNASPTYCQCSRAFIQMVWENALGRPLKVEVKETALSGAEECKFIIHLSS